VTVLTDTQVVTASGGLVELGYGSNTSDTTVTSGTNTVLIGPITVVCDGSPVLVDVFYPRVDAPTNGEAYATVELDGVSQGRAISANSPASLSFGAEHHGQIRLTPAAGSHTFQLRGYANTASGVFRGASASGFPAAFLRVSKIVQATQWPAVTTGTIICTSSTRPASPFAGQQIYETDTSLSLTWSGSAWVKNVQQTSTATAVTTNVWQTPTLINSWVNYGGGWQGARYIKDDTGTVFIEGLVAAGTGTVFTLAAGYRPLNSLIFSTVANNAFARMDVTTAGLVQWNTGGTNAYVSLCCSFKASQ